MVWAIYYRESHSASQVRKSIIKNMFFEEIPSHSSPKTISVTREWCLVHFWWKIFPSNSQLLFWVIIFARFSWKCHAFLKQTCWFMWRYHDSTSTDKTYEKHQYFWWNHTKMMTQNRSWKVDENIFHQKCTKQHSFVTQCVFGDECDGISSKKHVFFMLFLTWLALWVSL